MRSSALRFLTPLVCVFSLFAGTANAQPTELFISEYIEGSSNNKAIEIYNGTGAPVNLSAGGYNIQMFFNGNSSAGLTINLAGVVAAGDVYVIAHASADAVILAQADQTNGSGWFNGDDAVVLRRGTTIIDAIGQTGFDPGSQWGTGQASTEDNTLRRKNTVTVGDAIANDVFDPAIEWDGFPINTFNGLGAHLNEPIQMTCGPTLIVALGAAGSRVVTATDADGMVSSFTLGSIAPAPPAGSFTLTHNTPAAAPGATASVTLRVADTAPLGTYTVQINGANADTPPQSDRCSLTVSVVAVTTYEIWTIQGSGAASPFVGQVVRTENNIVTALASNGFSLQTPDARADESAQTSNGIFVFTSTPPAVSVGQQVDVIGEVTEFFDWTEITNATITVDSSGHALPAAIRFGEIEPGVFVPSHVSVANELERFESMRVRVENGVATGPTDRFGDAAIVAHGRRAFREPGILFPGDPGHPIVWDGNPEVIEIDPNGAGLPHVDIAAGTMIEVAEGPLAFAFGDYQIWPTTLVVTEPSSVLRPVRARTAGEFTVASQNLLRFFDNDRTNGPDDGAPNAAMYAGKLIKASLHIRTVLGAPDVLVIEEVENLGVAQALASQIAADDPSLAYTAYLIEGHDIGGIDTGMLVRDTISVASVGQIGADTIFEPGANQPYLHDRPPLVLTGAYIANGAPFPISVIGVHNRSLSDIETSTRVRQKRLLQAAEMANYVQSIQAAEPDRRLVLTGDFNAFQFSDGYVDAVGIITGTLDPNGAIHPGHVDVVDPNLVDQVSTLPEAERYSYIFDGSAQVLDHTLTTANLSPYIRGLQFARGNADAPAAWQADPATPAGLSDHDGEVLFLMSDRDADGLADDVDGCPASSLTVVSIGACTTSIPDRLIISGCSITDSIAQIAEASPNHGMFVSQTTHFASELRSKGVIDNRQRSEVVRCAATTKVP